ncbi:hypothetical protein V2T44_13040 [Serratia ficaria]|uniref:hypothetical protein n=1 Tax=Serratia TaxID=613 RepID=UPI001013C362|nr:MULTISPECIES: hypothetical protein [Serratia]MEE4483869.1 hypothetical protein [Serratia ficaria]VVA48435.1 hypothetical protein SERVES_02170 [Serratia ficaria]
MAKNPVTPLDTISGKSILPSNDVKILIELINNSDEDNINSIFLASDKDEQNAIFYLQELTQPPKGDEEMRLTARRVNLKDESQAGLKKIANNFSPYPLNYSWMNHSYVNKLRYNIYDSDLARKLNIGASMFTGGSAFGTVVSWASSSSALARGASTGSLALAIAALGAITSMGSSQVTKNKDLLAKIRQISTARMDGIEFMVDVQKAVNNDAEKKAKLLRAIDDRTGRDLQANERLHSVVNKLAAQGVKDFTYLISPAVAVRNEATYYVGLTLGQGGEIRLTKQDLTILYEGSLSV